MKIVCRIAALLLIPASLLMAETTPTPEQLEVERLKLEIERYKLENERRELSRPEQDRQATQEQPVYVPGQRRSDSAFRIAFGKSKLDSEIDDIGELEAGWLELAMVRGFSGNGHLFWELSAAASLTTGEYSETGSYGWDWYEASYEIGANALGAHVGAATQVGVMDLRAKVGVSLANIGEDFYYSDSDGWDLSDSESTSKFGFSWGIQGGLRLGDNHVIGIAIGQPHKRIRYQTLFWQVHY